MAITVGFDATAAVRQAAGIGRYTRELLGALARREDDMRYRLFYWGAGERHGWLPSLDHRFRARAYPISDRVANAVWHRAQIPLPVEWVTGGIDLYHSPDFTLPPVRNTPTILTVHDLAFLTVPECAYPTLRTYLERAVPRSVKRADRIIAVSQSTRDDLVRLLDADPRRITVIPEGVGPAFRPLPETEAQPLLAPLGLPHDFILSIGTIEPRKNYLRLIEAYALLRQSGVTQHLVIGGRWGWLYEPILARLQELRLEQYVQFIQPNDAQLPALYSQARLFVYPSLYEGFGIPPLEALACGSAVASSSSSSMPEVMGDAAMLFDPLDVQDMAETMLLALTDVDVRARLGHVGPARAGLFSWDSAAEQTAALYRQVANA